MGMGGVPPKGNVHSRPQSRVSPAGFRWMFPPIPLRRFQME
jgi:hypothetical protein